MKETTLKFIIPLTIITFIMLNKWWYVDVIDGGDEIMFGFPLIYTCRGFHTSMSIQFFILEFLFDLLCYFTFWLLLFYAINKNFKLKIKHSIISISLYLISGILIGLEMLFVLNPDNIFKLKRNFDIEIMETGYKFFWQNTEKPDYYKYHSEHPKENK
jgi:hypothetical protein